MQCVCNAMLLAAEASSSFRGSLLTERWRGRHHHHTSNSTSTSASLLSVRSSALANDGSFTRAPPLSGETGLDLELKGVQQHLTVSKKREDVWAVSDASRGYSGPHFTSEIAEGAAASEEESVSRDIDSGRSSSYSALRLDPVQEIKDIGEILRTRAETLKEEISRSEPITPYSPVEGPASLEFAVTCALLFFVFWVGNYLVPDLIFKNTVFGEPKDDPLTGTSSSGDDKKAFTNQKEPGDTGDTNKIQGGVEGVNSTSQKVVTGFGRSRPRSLKNTRRK